MKRLLFFLTIFVFITTINDAYAYIRPGAGNDLIQILVSAVASIGAFFKNLVSKIKGIFGGNKQQ